MNTIKIEDFQKIELKTGTILSVEKVETSKKLLKFRISDGSGEQRTIFSGIAKYYPDLEALVGKHIVFVANLEPREMLGEKSEGMLLSAEKEDKLSLLFVDSEIGAGGSVG